ncbi:MAG: tRNA threonylcarbamoyladenosine dehydratase [Bacteroidales bacterium]|nr:tRNA threonylcarbamoyladenosine dehydratase [Bacteroidales bacterium]
MIPDWLNRSLILLGEENLIKLQKAHVLVVGLGGVGAYAAEMICRAGISPLTLVDGDRIEASNRNRQLIALSSNQNIYKTQCLKERFLDINPDATINIVSEFIRDDRIDEILDSANYDYLIDAIDTLSPKVHLIIGALERNIPLVSAMGAGGKLNPLSIEISDISKTYQCPLAAAVRKKLKQKGINKGFKAVFSTEKISKNAFIADSTNENKASIVGSISYLPAIFGCHCAAVCINDLLKT